MPLRTTTGRPGRIDYQWYAHAKPVKVDAKLLVQDGTKMKDKPFGELADPTEVVDDLATAIADCVVVCGTTARRRQLRKNALLPPHQLADRIVDHAREGKVALLFGTERTGLTNPEIDRCRFVSMVPTDEAQPSLNLAQAVMLYAWEIRKAWLRADGKDSAGKIRKIERGKRMQQACDVRHAARIWRIDAAR